MNTCALGFIFDSNLEQVLLVHKNKPAWQAGSVNGVGGKVEPGETAIDCMVRECQEETTLEIAAEHWKRFATIEDTGGMSPGSEIAIFAAVYSGDRTDAVKNDHEEIEWFPHQQLPENVNPNLRFLVPLALEVVRGHGVKEVIINY